MLSIRRKRFFIEENRCVEKNMEKIQEKGVQIFENDVKIETDEKSCSARGQFTLIQRTGKRVERTRTDS